MRPPLVAHFVNNLIQVNALVRREEHAQLQAAVRLDLLQTRNNGRGNKESLKRGRMKIK